MKLQEDIDFTTLNWVKQELDETLGAGLQERLPVGGAQRDADAVRRRGET